MIAEFWANVDIRGANECWPWVGVFDDEYGSWKGERAHRVAWELTHFEAIPSGLFALHRCDYPPCCNAKRHLRLGTARDNAHDMFRRNRARFGASLELAMRLNVTNTLPLFEDAPRTLIRIGRPRATHIGVCAEPTCRRRVRVRRGVAESHGWSTSDTLLLFGARCEGSGKPPLEVRELERRA